jgi:Mg2+/Co2+ transporter CorC
MGNQTSAGCGLTEILKKEDHSMEKMKVRELMVPTEGFPKISNRASFYEALAALETAQEKYLSGEAGQRILMVEDDEGKVMGKLSPIDLFRGLEANYDKVDAEKILTRSGLRYIWKSMQEEYHLWENPFKDLCRKAAEVRVKDFIKGPSEGQCVRVDDPLTKCVHLFIMNRHDALFVLEGDEIIGLLRFSDVYKEASRTMKACSIETMQ